MTTYDVGAASRHVRSNGICYFALTACVLGSHATIAAVAAAPKADLALLPLNFEANIGQADSSQVQYLAHGKSYGIELTKRGARLALAAGQASASEVIRLQLLGSVSDAAPTAEQPLPGKVNYFIGNDPAQWRTGVSTYGKVRYSSVYPGVDLVYYGNQGHLEYDFDIAPGADPSKIGVRFEGANKLHLGANGDLAIETQGGRVTFEKPVAYQWDGERRIPVAATYRLAGKSLRFSVGAYDHSRALIIDPVLSYFSYLGGSNQEYMGGASGYYFTNQGGMNPAGLDANKNLYVVGQTQSTNFPTKNPFAKPATKTGGGDGWAYVTSISPDATTLNYSTYLGGSVNDAAASIAVDSSGNAFVVGTTDSNDFPIVGGYQTVCDPNLNNAHQVVEPGCQYGENSAWVARLNVSGALVASTFLSGTNTLTQGNAIAIDAADRVYITGITIPGQTIPTGIAYTTASVAFPTTPGALLVPPPYTTANDDISEQPYDAYVAVFNPTLSTLLYSTLYGDTQVYNPNVNEYLGMTYGFGIAVDSANNFYLAATTNDGFLPTTAGAYQQHVSSCDPYQAIEGGHELNVQGTCGLVVKFSPVVTATGSATVPKQIYGTYVGGYPTPAGSYSVTSLSGIAVDSSGDAYVLGFTNTSGFPTTPGAYQTSCNANGDTECHMAVVAKINPTGTALLAATYFGCATCSGDNVYGPGSLALDLLGNVYITGIADASIAQVHSISAGSVGSDSPFVAKFSPTLNTLLFASLLNPGGSQAEGTGTGVAVDSKGNIYLAGSTNTNGGTSTATPGVFQTSLGGLYDGWVAKITTSILADSVSLGALPDYFGAGDAQFTVWRPASGDWYSANAAGTSSTTQWGVATDLPVIGDFDGDGKSDVAVWRPSTGSWDILQSSNKQVVSHQWGIATDIPVAGDFDGDGKTDLAVFRPSTGYWYIVQSSNNAVASHQWGVATDIPVAGDFDGDGKTDLAVFRPSTGYWYIVQSSNNEVASHQWGAATDMPVLGDFDGDGKTDIAVFRPSTGYWYIIQSSNGAVVSKQWGQSGDVPVARDYDGDGKTDIAVYRPSTGYWYVVQSSNGEVVSKQWGDSTDVPVNSLRR